jgi:hypothetical protein
MLEAKMNESSSLIARLTMDAIAKVMNVLRRVFDGVYMVSRV